MRTLRNVLCVLALCATAAGAQATTYAFTALGTLGGSISHAWGINNAGQIAGTSLLPGDVGFFYGALYESPGAPASNLGAIGGSSSWAFAVDSSGRPVGWASTAGDASSQPVVWDPSGAIVLPTTGGRGGGAYSVNSSGSIVGSNDGHASLWSGGTQTDLSSVSGLPSSAQGINNTGQIVGFRQVGTMSPFTPINRATLWDGATTVDLGTLGGLSSYAYGINDAGVIVGISDIVGNLVQRAVLWNGAPGPIDLGTLPGGTVSFAYAINSVGTIVGSAYLPALGTGHATLWLGTELYDLNDLLDPVARDAGWILTEARAVNDHGWIVGSANNTLTGQTRGFVLTPIPEPAAGILLLLGIAAMPILAPRRRLLDVGRKLGLRRVGVTH